MVTEEADKSNGTCPCKPFEEREPNSNFFNILVTAEYDSALCKEKGLCSNSTKGESTVTLTECSTTSQPLCLSVLGLVSLKAFFFHTGTRASSDFQYLVFSSMECTFCASTPVYVATQTWTELHGIRDHEVPIWTQDSKRLVNYTKGSFRTYCLCSCKWICYNTTSNPTFENSH